MFRSNLATAVSPKPEDSKKIGMHRENFSVSEAQTSPVWPYAVARAIL